jgi:hypothetical protein
MAKAVETLPIYFDQPPSARSAAYRASVGFVTLAIASMSITGMPFCAAERFPIA